MHNKTNLLYFIFFVNEIYSRFVDNLKKIKIKQSHYRPNP